MPQFEKVKIRIGKRKPKEIVQPIVTLEHIVREIEELKSRLEKVEKRTAKEP